MKKHILMHILNFMTNYLRNKCSRLSYLVSILLVFLFFSCEKNNDDVGLELFPSEQFLRQDTVGVYDLTYNTQKVNLAEAPSFLFGKAKTPTGDVVINQYFPFVAGVFYSKIFDVTFVEAKFICRDIGFYIGDTTVPLEITISIPKNLPAEQDYENYTHPDSFENAEEVMSFTYLPTPSVDGVDSLSVPLLLFERLPHAVGERIFNDLRESTFLPTIDTTADETVRQDQMDTAIQQMDLDFVNRFPGFIVKVSDGQNDASIIRLTPAITLFGVDSNNDTVDFTLVYGQKLTDLFYYAPLPDMTHTLNPDVEQHINGNVDSVGYVQGFVSYQTTLGNLGYFDEWLTGEYRECAVNFAQLSIPSDPQFVDGYLDTLSLLYLNIYLENAAEKTETLIFPIQNESFDDFTYTFNLTSFFRYFQNNNVSIDNYRFELISPYSRTRVSAAKLIQNKDFNVKIYHTQF